MSPSPADQRDLPASDSELAPLAWPTVIVAVAMLVTAAVYAVRVPRWATDYGSLLVYFAVVVYVAVALVTLRWGLAIHHRRTRRTRPSTTEAPDPDRG